MSKETIADNTAVFLGVLPKEIRDRVPDRCKRCPTLLKLAQHALMEQGLGNSSARKALRSLDRAETADETLPGVAARHRADAAVHGGRSERMLAQRDDTLATIDELVPATEECPGALLGNYTVRSRAELLLTQVAGQYWGWGPRERSCPNPAFEDMQSDPDINGALRYGNWVGGVVIDRPDDY